MSIIHSHAPRFAMSGSVALVLVLFLATASHAETRMAVPSIFRTCSDALDHSSNSIIDNDGHRTVTVKLDGGRCAIDFRLEGKAEFNDDFTDIVSLSRDGSLRLDVKDDGERRRLEIVPGSDDLVRTWSVNGRERAYDATAREWFAAFLVELDRRTAIGVDQRLPVLLRKGGVAAVLGETGQMRSDYARGVYYSKLAAVTRLSSGDLVRVLGQAASMKTDDYYASELLKNLGARAGDDAGVRAAMLRLIQGMSGDYYRAESVKELVGKGRLDASEMDFVIGVMPTMKSDYYKTEVLKKIVASGIVDPAQRKRLIALVPDIHEAAYAFEFVKALTASGDAKPGEARALVDAAATIGSDYYQYESFAAILRGPKLVEGDLLAIVKAVAPSKSEHYKSETLRLVLAHRAVTDAVRHAALDAADGMSAYYREEIARTLGRR